MSSVTARHLLLTLVLPLAILWLVPTPFVLIEAAKTILPEGISFLAGLLWFYVWITICLAAIIWCVASLVKKMHLHALAASTLPLAMLFLAWRHGPWAPLAAPLYAGDVRHFAIAKPSYDRAIAGLSGQRRSKTFKWSDDGFFHVSAVIYDDSDRLGNGHCAQPKSCGINDNWEVDNCPGSYELLWDHYYLADFDCD